MNPILQFGTSRFLQAHVDLFVSEAQQAPDGQALGGITVVQGSGNAASLRRMAAFNQPGGFPVRIRGRQDGADIDEERRVSSVTEALGADTDWAAIVARVAGPVRVIVSNTADRGYLPDPADHAGLLGGPVAPRGFPARLLVLLHARFLGGAAPVTLLPCELVVRNGDVLRALVLDLARDWRLDAAFIAYLERGCVWVNSLVDRIVSEPLEPLGAVAEPYALWAIEAQPGMLLPCRHRDIVVTDDLEKYASLKLYLLNLGHTWLAQMWLDAGRPEGMTVRQAMVDPAWLAALNGVWHEEVLPVFAATGQEAAARAYLAQVRERFGNPYLAHRLADIADNHAEKKRRRFAPVVALAAQHGLALPQARLRAALANDVEAALHA
jgi:tagaturonate reductase